MKPELWSKVDNFKKSEWVQDPDRVPSELVFPIDKLRSATGVPIWILEAYAESGHAEYSYHYIGLAVDFYFEPGKLSPLEQFLYISMIPEFGGIGFYPNESGVCSWHVDLRTDSPRVVWFRDFSGNYIYNPLSFMEALCQASS